MLRPAPMTVFLAARQHGDFRLRSIFHAACARSVKIRFTIWADCVEKLLLDRMVNR